MRMSSFLNVMRNAITQLFRQHLVFTVYKCSLDLGFVSLSIKIAFINLKKDLKCLFISSGLLVGHTSVFRMVVIKSFCSFFKSSQSNNKWSVV